MESAEPQPRATLSSLAPNPLSIISASTVALGILYQWGFWSQFNINVLPFMSLSDIVKSFAYPFLASFIFFLSGAVLSANDPIVLKPGAGADTKVGRFLNRLKIPLALLFGGVIALVFVFGGSFRWIMAAGLLTILLNPHSPDSSTN